MTAATTTTLTQVRHEEREVEQRPLSLGLLMRLMRYTRPYAGLRNRLTMLVLMRAAQLPLLAALAGLIIKGPIAERWAWHWILLASLGYLVWSALTQYTMYYRQKYAMELGEAIVHDLRQEIFDHLQRMPMSYFNKNKVGRIISRITSDAENVRAGVQNFFFASLVSVGQMVISAAIMVYYDWVLFLLVLGLAPVLYLLNQYFMVRLSKLHRQAAESFSRITATLAESVTGIRVTQSFVRQDVNAEMFRELVADHSDHNVNASRTAGLFRSLLELNNQFFIAGLMIVGGYAVLSPRLSTDPGDLVQFLLVSRTFFDPLTSIGQIYDQAVTSMAGAERVFGVLDTEPENLDSDQAVELPIRGRVEFEDVCFEYVPNRPVLHDINFKVKPGKTVALVGHTGSGKSSIISLISKFYLPTEGKLLIDGVDIHDIATESLHKQMGLVTQVNFLFTGTVMDNIRLGKPGASDEQVMAAARQLDCYDLIEDLPEGFMTQVGERGGNMSLGQRQLVCFCRAMLADPRIMILDEATSSVDTMTEARIQKALSVLLRGRTSFVVAHRLSTIRHADVVLVLDHGRIVERGTHQELLVTGGVYSNLYRQFIRASEA